MIKVKSDLRCWQLASINNNSGQIRGKAEVGFPATALIMVNVLELEPGASWSIELQTGNDLNYHYQPVPLRIEDCEVGTSVYQLHRRFMHFVSYSVELLGGKGTLSAVMLASDHQDPSQLPPPSELSGFNPIEF